MSNSVSGSAGLMDFYKERTQMRDQATDPALKQHFQAELDVVKKTMEAQGMSEGDIDGGYDSGYESGDNGDIDGGDPASETPVVKPGVFTEKTASHENTGKPSSVSGEHTGQGTKVGSGLPPQGEQYREAIESASAKSGVPASLMAGLIHDESRWDDKASTVNGGNGGGDTGLVQMNDNTFKELQTKHPDLAGKNKNDPETNILAGAYYLADMKTEMKEKYGVDSWDIALRAYNSGPNGVDPNNLNALPAGTGTASYVDKITNYWSTIDNGGQLPA